MNIIITGSSQGLGLALASSLFEQGHEIIGISRREDNQPWKTYQCDIQNYGDICITCGQISRERGYIDVLINNAGVILSKKMSDYKLTEVQDVIDTNVIGTFLMTQYMTEVMTDQRRGYIINIGSTRSITAAPNKSLYSMSKFAIRALTQSINIEYNKYGVYSTLICSGAIEEGKVTHNDIIKTVNYLLSMPITAKIPELVIGGQL
jgi:short-subunit dehydrogenase